MKIIYVSSLCTQATLCKLFNSFSFGQAIQKYHRLLAEGLSRQPNTSVRALSALPVSRKTHNNIFIHVPYDVDGKVKYEYIPTINLPVIKNIFTAITSFIKTIKMLREDDDTIVVCDVLNVSVAAGAVLAAKIMKKKSAGIVTDVPNCSAGSVNSIVKYLNTRLIDCFDAYVFLTEAMSELIKCNGKKYVVVEGQVDIGMENQDNNVDDKNCKKICIYAGGIKKIYGIEYMVQGFLAADVKNAELHIYGSGDYEDELMMICAKNSNVKFLGTIANEEIVREEIKATLLVNPRPSNQAYTKYSFPSKNMEYMVSGTPLLTTKLPGMPAEYQDFVYIIEEETADGICKCFNQLLSQPSDKLFEFGARSKAWVLAEKNNIKQSGKILEMLKSILS